MLSATWLLHPLCPERRWHTQMGPCWASESEHQTAAQWTPFEMWRQRPSCFQHGRLANSLPRWFNTFKAVRGQNFWSVWCFECGVSACPPCWPNPTFACVAICAPALCNSPWWTARRQTALAALDSSQTTKESCRLLATSPHPGPSQSIQIYPDPRFKVWERWVVGFNLGIWIDLDSPALGHRHWPSGNKAFEDFEAVAEDLLKLSILLELMTQMFSGGFGFGTIKLYGYVWKRGMQYLLNIIENDYYPSNIGVPYFQANPYY